jgi:sec-independent protein translocase protein TatC
MYLLKKIIQIRQNSHQDHEKPFLEHLEDLRIMVTRIVITLVISMTVCFSFQKDLMEVLRRPVEQVWITQLEQKLPKESDKQVKACDVETWEKAKEIAHAAAGLDEVQRGKFYGFQDQTLVFHAKSVLLLKAALALPEKARDSFMVQLEVPEEMRQQIKYLIEKQPGTESGGRGSLKMMSALKPTETFMLSMKLSFFAGVIIAFPLLLLYVLQFILPGLHQNEKRVLWPSLVVGFGLFLMGVSFAYFQVLPRALSFFHDWSGTLGVSNDWRIGEYISFATQFTLLFGLSFELPVVVMVLVKLGMLSYQSMSSTRGYAILAIFIAAAILTPTPDAFTLCLMAGPMIVLYEICIWLAWFIARKERIEAAKDGYGGSNYSLRPALEPVEPYVAPYDPLGPDPEPEEVQDTDPTESQRTTYSDLYDGSDGGWESSEVAPDHEETKTKPDGDTKAP